MVKEKFTAYLKNSKEKSAKLKDYLSKVFKNRLFKAVSVNLAQALKKCPYFDKLSEIFNKKYKRVISIDFGPGFVKIIYLESKYNSLTILNYSLKRISTRENKDEITNFINNFLKTNSISEKEAYLTISDLESIIIKDVTLPVIPRREISEALKWQLREEVKFDLREALSDWQIINEYTDEEGAKKNDILFVTVKREIVDRYLSIVSECDLFPIKISSAPFNYASLLACYEEIEDERRTQAILDIGYKETVLCIYKNNKLNFVRLLPFSSDKLTQAMTSTLFSDRGKFDLSYEKAEEIKEAVGIPQNDSLVLEDNITAGQISSLMRTLLEDLVRDLKRSFNYFLSNYKEEPSILYITGGGSNLKNLDAYLKEKLNINAYKLFLPENIDTQAIAKEKLDKVQNQIINAIGAVLAGTGGINLLPPEVRTQRFEFIEKVSLRLIALAVGAILFSSFLFVKLQIRDYRQRLEYTNVHLQTIKEIKILKQKSVLMEGLIDKIQRSKVPVDGLLKVVSSLTPYNITLNELLFSQDKHILILRGVVSQDVENAGLAITNFMGKIEASPFFVEATLSSSRRIGLIHIFEIRCDLIH